MADVEDKDKDLVLEENQLSAGTLGPGETGTGVEVVKKKKKRIRHRRKPRNAAVFNNSMGEPNGGHGSVAAGSTAAGLSITTQNIDVLEKLDDFINANKAACKLLLTQNQVRDSSKEENSKRTSVTSDDSGIKVLYKCNALMDLNNLGDSSMSVNKCGIENDRDFKQTIEKHQKAINEMMVVDDEVDFNKVPNPSRQSIDVHGNKMKITIKEMNEIPRFTPHDLKKKLHEIQNQALKSKGLQRYPKDNVKNEVMSAGPSTDVEGEAVVKISPKNAASFCGTGTDYHLRNQEQKTTLLKTTSAHSTLGKLDEDKLPSFVQIHMDQNTNYLVEHYQSDDNEGENKSSAIHQQETKRRRKRNAAEFLKFYGELQMDNKTSFSANHHETGANYSSNLFNQNDQDQGLLLENENEYQNEASTTTTTTKGEFVQVELDPNQNYFSTTEFGTSFPRYVSAVVEDPKDNGEEDIIPNSQSKIKSKSSKEHSGKEKKSTSGFKSFFSCFSSKKKDKNKNRSSTK